MISLPFMTPAQAQEPTIDALFAQLQNQPADSDRIIEKIKSIWAESGSASMDLLLKRGHDAREAGDLTAAIEHFSALVDHAPEFPEAYNARALAYFEAGYIGPAVVDLRMALALNPRHFKAMTGLAILQESLGQPENALKTYRMVLDLLPNNKDILASIARLEGVAL